MNKIAFNYSSWLIVTLTVIGLLEGCGGGGGSVSPTPAPSIASFVAARPSITTGTSTTLTAVFANGTGTVDNGIGTITSGEARDSGNLMADTTFRLTVIGAGTTLTRDILVSVVAPALKPVITAPAKATVGDAHLAASVPDQVGCTFTWTITGGTFTGGETGASGRSVTFSAGTTGTLVLTCRSQNAAGTESALGVASIDVVAAPGIASFTAPPAITMGDSANLTAIFSGGTGILTPGDVSMTSAVPVTVRPTTNTNYTLTITNLAGNKLSSTLTILVAAPPWITSFTGAPTTIPARGKARLSAAFSGGSGVITPGNLAIASGVPVEISPTSTTAYTLSITNAAGATTSSIAVVNVVDRANVSITADNHVLAGATQLAASIPSNPTATYTWFIANGVLTDGQGSNQIHFTAGPPGVLSLVCLETDSLGSRASDATVTVVAVPSASMVAQPQVHIEDAPLLGSVPPQSGSAISWALSAGSIHGTQTSNVLQWTSPGSTGTVTLTVQVQNQEGDAATTTRSIEVVQGKWLKHVRQKVARTMGFSSTTLLDGRILVAGGIQENHACAASAEVFDAGTNAWYPVGSMASARQLHTATLLPDGRVLVSGGLLGGTGALAGAELYDPTTRLWSTTGSMNAVRFGHTATCLPDGKVLVAGGSDGNTELGDAELFDPATEAWTRVANLPSRRAFHTANLLTDGRVLVTGGQYSLSASLIVLTSSVIFDPTTSTWSSTGVMSSKRTMFQSVLLPSGKVLVGSNGQSPATELFDPRSNSWSSGGVMLSARLAYSMTLLANGKVLVCGGVSGSDTLTSAELYDPETDTWSLTGSLTLPRMYHHTVLLPNGKVVVHGGEYSAAFPIAGIELFDPATETWSDNGCLGSLRAGHTATRLANGTVLVSGGADNNSLVYSDTRLYDPGTDTFTTSAPMTEARFGHTAIRLPDGRVLVAGGTYLDTTELFDPVAVRWTRAGTMSDPRAGATATLLSNGKVLVTGGWRDSSTPLSSVELFDPTTGLWTSGRNMASTRGNHTATLLANGKVLIVGGLGSYGWNKTLPNAEVYDPLSNTWSSAGGMSATRHFHTATLLPNGKVLVAGGNQDGGVLTELFDPSSNTWSTTGSLMDYRAGHTATMLPDGLVLVAGGTGYGDWSTALYDAATGTWAPTGNLTSYRGGHSATLLDNGKVMVVGGGSEQPALDSVEFYK